MFDVKLDNLDGDRIHKFGISISCLWETSPIASTTARRTFEFVILVRPEPARIQTPNTFARE